MKDLFGKIAEEVQKASNVLILSHRDPDPDTLGAGIAVYSWIVGLGKKAQLVAFDRPIDNLQFLPLVDLYQQDFDLEEYDLIVAVDIASSELVGFQVKYSKLFSAKIPVINIDHHPSNDFFGTINLVDPSAASATIIIYDMFEYLGVEINEDMATALLAGIYGDTGSFMHSNTELRAYKVAANLLKMGARIDLISKFMFRTRPVSTLKLWGKVLENAHLEGKGVVVSQLTEKDFAETDSAPEQLTGIVDYLNMVPDAKFSLLINEDRKGNVRGSLRTRRADVDVSKIAATVGGGGHAKASGFTVPGELNPDFVKKHFLI